MRYRDGQPVEIEKRRDLDPARREERTIADPDDLWEHVVEPILPRELYDARSCARTSTSTRRAASSSVARGRLRPDRAQDHRRHLRRHGAPRRRRVLGQGPEQGRSLGRVRRALHRQERRRRRARRPLRGAVRLRDRRRAAGLDAGRDVRDRRRSAARRSPGSVDEHFDLRPGAFREYLRLHRPIYQKTAAYGHFGREDHDFTWERTDKAEALRAAPGSAPAPRAAGACPRRRGSAG